ncbi:unnamed protein product [Paramecium primaurelia]|uniref:Casein kinase I n=1 Tax=Paramecium primaurelia TaxID=5886 RepID=A0A8S1LXQ1_PARPR|nr:unnamed protein product [Paramecium primaurelia]CAD8073600.1 unnamed protein product [Paramecium primaurelia]
MISNVDTFQMFNIIKEIYENENQKVYISNLKDKFKIIVLKVQVGNKKYLYNQYIILDQLKFVQGVPKILNYGYVANEKFYYSIDYYGKSVADILNKYGTLTLQSVLSIGLSILRILSGIHRQEIIYGNICPENIVFSKEGVDHDSQLHLIGFGQAYLKYEKPKRFQNKKSLPYYIQNNRVSSKKDDLESLGYLLIKLRKGTLPWEQLPEQLMGQKKIECLKSNEILQELPYEFRFFFQQINLFNEEPKHQYLIKLLNSIMLKYCKTTQHCITELNQLTPITEVSNETGSSMDSCYLCTIIPKNMSHLNVLTNREQDSSIEEKLKRLQLISKQYKLISNL